MSAKKKAKPKLDPNDPLTPVKLFMLDMEEMDRRAVEVTQLAHKRGAKAEQIAEAMNVSRRTVYNRLEGIAPSGKVIV